MAQPQRVILLAAQRCADDWAESEESSGEEPPPARRARLVGEAIRNSNQGPRHPLTGNLPETQSRPPPPSTDSRVWFSRATYFHRTQSAPWSPRVTFASSQEVCYTMAGMARGISLVLCFLPKGHPEEVKYLSQSCSRWDFALRLAVQKLLGM